MSPAHSTHSTHSTQHACHASCPYHALNDARKKNTVCTSEPAAKGHTKLNDLRSNSPDLEVESIVAFLPLKAKLVMRLKFQAGVFHVLLVANAASGFQIRVGSDPVRGSLGRRLAPAATSTSSVGVGVGVGVGPLFSSTLDANDTDEASTKKKKKPKPNYIKNEREAMAKKKSFLRGAGVFKDVKAEVTQDMKDQFDSEMMNKMKDDPNYMMEKEGVEFYLAKDHGFCWGGKFISVLDEWVHVFTKSLYCTSRKERCTDQKTTTFFSLFAFFIMPSFAVERSINLAYSAVETFPDSTLHITNELIHNPMVNERLHKKNVNFIEKDGENAKDFSQIKEGDVVMLPAFGAALDEMK